MKPLTLMVCPHDTTNNPDRWYRLMQYLSPRTDIPLHLELSLDFADFRANLHGADIVYASPSDSLQLVDERGFAPLVKPVDRCDEAILIASAAMGNPTAGMLAGAEVATVPGLLPARVALHSLERRGIAIESFHDCESWLGVISAVYQGKAPFGIVYADTYDALSSESRAMVKPIERTSECLAHHCVVAGPQAQPHAEELRRLLVAMSQEPAGRELLGDLGIPAWAPLAQADLQPIRDLMAR